MNDPLDRSFNSLIPQKMVTPEARRIALDHASNEYGVSQRWACKVLGVDRSSIRYASVRPDDGDLRIAMKKRIRTEPIWLSTHPHQVGTAGYRHEHEESSPTLSGGEAPS